VLSSLRLLFIIVKPIHQEWTVAAVPQGPTTASPQTYDPPNAVRSDVRMPVTLLCRSDRRPGIQYEVEGWLTTTRWFSEGKTGRDPWAFEMGQFIGLRYDEPPTSDEITASGQGSLYRAVKRFYRDLAEHDPSMWGAAKSLPPPGRRGLPDGHYALWAKRYLDAVEQHGRGYLPTLLAEHPGITKANLHRTVTRAEDLGLCVIHRSPGNVSSGHMTDKGLRLLAEAAESNDQENGERA
jgi:hypothetical protein